MAKVRMKEKTDAGHKILHPETLALNVITGTGNVQNDITNLMNEVGKLGNQIIEVKFKIEKETIEEEDLPILNMYDFDGNKTKSSTCEQVLHLNLPDFYFTEKMVILMVIQLIFIAMC